MPAAFVALALAAVAPTVAAYAHCEGLARRRAFQGAFDKGRDPFGQHRAATRQPLSRHVGTQFQFLCDTFDRPMFAVEKNQRLTVSVWNLFQRAPKNRFLLMADGLR